MYAVSGVVSDCCGEAPVLNSEDVGLCPACKEHCEYVDLNARESPQSHPLDGDLVGQVQRAIFHVKSALNHAEHLLGRLEQKSNTEPKKDE